MKKLAGCIFLLLAFTLPLGLSAQSQAELPYNWQPQKPEYKNPQSFWMADTLPNRKRLRTTLGISFGGYAVAYTGIALAWYGNYPKSKFHVFRDIHEWKQVDKMGHFLGGYQGGRGMIGLLKWGGMERKKAAIIGGLTGGLMLIPIEILDGFADKWGYSWGDTWTDLGGGLLAMGNELLWAEQRIQFKVSYHPTGYAERRPDLFGDKYSKFLKDYNGHTCWLSARIHSFLPESKFKDKYPRWLNVAVGYGANGLLGGYDNGITPEIEAREYRQYYLSFDIDLSAIKTRSGFLDFLLSTVNFIHLPMPTIEYNGKHGLVWHWLYM